MTGAGWGGCVISLILEKDMDSFMDALEKKYYAHIPSERKIGRNYLFGTTPGSGAKICVINANADKRKPNRDSSPMSNKRR